MLLRDGDPRGEAVLRQAIESLVDAFLVDRRGNAGCFARAHRIGALVENQFRCSHRFDPETRSFSIDCGIHALHRRSGVSFGGNVLTECSICSAAEFDCEHVPDETYDGKRCFRRVTRWDAKEVSFVKVPADPRCYRVTFPMSVADAERLKGARLAPGDRPLCTHCRTCPGAAAPAAEDLDPSTWPDLPEEE